MNKDEQKITVEPQSPIGDTKTLDMLTEQEKADPNGAMFVKLWAKTKEKPDYAEFLAYLDEISMSEDMIEEFYTAKDRVAGFVDWKKGGSPFQ